MKNLRLTILSLLFLLTVNGCKKQQEAPPPPPSVTVVPVVSGSVVQTHEIIGQAKAYDDVELVARVKGFLTKRNFVEGSKVTKGQLLFEIEPDEYQAKVESSEAMLKRAQAKQMNTDVEYNRQKKLLGENATAKRTYDDALASKMMADADVMDCQASLALAKLNLSYTKITSPFDGRIGFATYSVGNVVGPESKSLASVVTTDPVRIEFNINEVDLLNLNLNSEKRDGKPRDNIIVKLKFQNNTIYRHNGKIEFSSNKINISTGTLLVEAVFPNQEGIIVPGMYVKVFIVDTNKIPALLIPQSAVLQDQAGEYVLIVNKENKVEERRIKTGITSGLSIQISEGLKDGELVITDGIQKIRKNIKVSPVVAPNQAASDDGIEPVKKDKVAVPAGKHDAPASAAAKTAK